MSPPLIVLRPEPGATATARRIAAMGRRAIVAPLFEVAPVAWDPPDPASFDALLLTSANAARQGGMQLARYAGLPVYAVGLATAQAAREAGFGQVRIGDGDVTTVAELAQNDGALRLLHLAGREHRSPANGAIRVTQRIVYASDPVAAMPHWAIGPLGEGGVAILHSGRAAALFRRLVDEAGLAPEQIAIAGISASALDQAGTGWRVRTAPAAPTDDGLLAAAARL